MWVITTEGIGLGVRLRTDSVEDVVYTVSRVGHSEHVGKPFSEPGLAIVPKHAVSGVVAPNDVVLLDGHHVELLEELAFFVAKPFVLGFEFGDPFLSSSVIRSSYSSRIRS
jgi:hypothetical protein